MKKLQGLTALIPNTQEKVNHKTVAELLLDDLQQCYCEIYGKQNERDVLLAQLHLQAGTLHYEPFDQRIDLMVEGSILRDDCVPLTYCLQGKEFAITGRCSMIGKVCGVDLYLSKTYTGKIGDVTQQRFQIYLKDVINEIK
jgi:hypothetical protein